MRARKVLGWVILAFLVGGKSLAQSPGGEGAAPAATTTVEKEAGAAGSAEAVTATETYSVKIKNLEEKVNELKEKIFRSKARLLLLQETVLHGSISGAKAVLYHRNEMGSSFKLEKVIYSLDGAPIYNKVDVDGDLDGKEEFEIFDGTIVPGDHALSVYMEFRGNGFGIFAYLKGYLFKVQSSYTFTAEEGKVTHVKSVAYEKGGAAADLKDRPAVRYDIDVRKDQSKADMENVRKAEE